jgi:hypothetical protein
VKFSTLVLVFVAAVTQFASAQTIAIDQLTPREREQYSRFLSEPAVAECYLKTRPFARSAAEIVRTRNAEIAADFQSLPKDFCRDKATHDKAMAGDSKIVSDALKLSLRALALKIVGASLKGRTLDPVDVSEASEQERARRAHQGKGITASQLTSQEREHYSQLLSEPAVAECYLKTRPFARSAAEIVRTRNAEIAADFQSLPKDFCHDKATHDKAMAGDSKIVSDAVTLSLQALLLKSAGVSLKGRTLQPPK